MLFEKRANEYVLHNIMAKMQWVRYALSSCFKTTKVLKQLFLATVNSENIEINALSQILRKTY